MTSEDRMSIVPKLIFAGVALGVVGVAAFIVWLGRLGWQMAKLTGYVG